MIKKELITKFLNKYKTKISSITFFINSIYQQNIFLYKIILQAGAPSWRNVYQVVSQLNPWIGSFSTYYINPIYRKKHLDPFSSETIAENLTLLWSNPPPENGGFRGGVVVYSKSFNFRDIGMI